MNERVTGMAATVQVMASTEQGRARLAFFYATRAQSAARVGWARRVARHEAWNSLRQA